MTGVAGFILLTGSCAERAIAQSAPETTGPNKVVEMDPSLPEHTVYRPEQVSRVKGKLPIVAGNGACANAGNAFENYLAEVASCGFLVVANGPIIPAAPGRPPKPGQPFPPFPAPPKGETGPTAGSGRPPFQQSKTSRLYETMDWAKVQNATDGSRSSNGPARRNVGCRFRGKPRNRRLMWSRMVLDLRLEACNQLILLVAGEGFEPSTFGL